MKKPVRIAIIALAVIIALMTMYLVVPGFTKIPSGIRSHYRNQKPAEPAPAGIPGGYWWLYY